MAQNKDASGGELVVTGSRIPRPNLTSPTPVTVIDARRVELTGEVNTGEILRQLPAIGLSAITPTNSNFQTTAVGITTVNLRNLGEDRTLVLMNGRRFVPGEVGTQAVDLNSIPTELIERIDVDTGGASAIYGSDALAGVVNIILKRDFQGLQINGQYNQTQRGDDRRYKLSGIAGANFADGKGNGVISMNYDTTTGVRASNRGDQGMGVDALNLAIFGTGDPNDYNKQILRQFSSFSEYGRIVNPNEGGGVRQVLNSSGAVVPFVTSIYGFNREAIRLLEVPSKRLSVASQLTYEVNDYAKIFTEVNWTRTSVHSTLEPTPLGSDQVFTDSTGVASLPFCDDFRGDGTLQCQAGIPLTSASIPAAVKAAVRAENAAAAGRVGLLPAASDADLVVGFARRMSEVGNRGADEQRTTFRVLWGVKGQIVPKVAYEFSMNYGRTDDNQQNSGDVNTLHLAKALDTVINSSGNEVCSDPVAVGAGCVPVHIFGLGSISSAGAAYIRAPTSRIQSVDEFVANGFFHGDIVKLPAGNLSYVIGGEYRKEESSDIPDALTQSGDFSGNATPPTVGSFDVKEIFGELRVPILADLPLVKSLDLNLSGRISDYSSVGTVRSYAASAEYQPVDWLKFRAQYALASRAPNISELFQGASQDFPTVADPCAGVTKVGGQAAFFNLRNDITTPTNVLASGVNSATLGNAVATACLADPAVAARVARDGGLALTQPETQGVSGFDTGNPNLGAESGKTFTVGAVFNAGWTPWLRPLSVSVDYYHIKIDNRIATIDQQIELDNCYGATGGYNPASQFCSPITRFVGGPSIGALQYVNKETGNFANTTTSGIDVQASYRFNLDDYGWMWGPIKPGSLTLTLDYSHLFALKTTPFPGATGNDIIDDGGTFGAAKNKWLAGALWKSGRFTFFWQTQFIGQSTFSNNTNDALYGAKLPRTYLHNAQIRFDVNDTAGVYFGVDNITDEYVFVGGTSGDAGQAVGWTTFPDVYDGLGRRYYTGIKLRF